MQGAVMGEIFANSTLGKTLDRNTLNVPANKVIPDMEHQEPMPHVILGDEAFPLIKRYLLRPYPGKMTQRECTLTDYVGQRRGYFCKFNPR